MVDPAAAATPDAVRVDVRRGWPSSGIRRSRSSSGAAGWSVPVGHVRRGHRPGTGADCRRGQTRSSCTKLGLWVLRTRRSESASARGTDAARGRFGRCESGFLRATVTGEYTWCQLFSEPGSGSDLAGLTTRAERDGDEWIVNGQKLWSTSAHHADYGLLLARTDWDVPKHRGITYFVLPMHQPGVMVRSLRQMNGHASFNEIFLTDRVCRTTMSWARRREGWRVALTTLAHERQFRTVAPPHAEQRATGGPCTRRASNPTSTSGPIAGIRSARVVPTWSSRWLARRAMLRIPSSASALPRSSRCGRAHQWTAQRAHAARVQGRPPGPEGSLGKPRRVSSPGQRRVSTP